MSNLDFVSKNVNEVEFYVRKDGQESGMSVSGLSRCCGVRLSTMQDLLEKIATGKSSLENVESFVNAVYIDLEPTVSIENNAKIVKSEVCAVVIAYYAFRSKAANEIAKHTLSKFVTIGIDSWIKKVTEFSKEEKLDQVVDMLKVLTDKVEDLTIVAAKYNNIKDTTTVTFQGLDEMLTDLERKELTDENVIKMIEAQTQPVKGLTIKEFLETKGLDVSHGCLCKFGRMVAETYKSCARKEPNKTHRKNNKGTVSSGVKIYSVEEIPLLEMSYRKFVNI